MTLSISVRATDVTLDLFEATNNSINRPNRLMDVTMLWCRAPPEFGLDWPILGSRIKQPRASASENTDSE